MLNNVIALCGNSKLLQLFSVTLRRSLGVSVCGNIEDSRSPAHILGSGKLRILIHSPLDTVFQHRTVGTAHHVEIKSFKLCKSVPNKLGKRSEDSRIVVRKSLVVSFGISYLVVGNKRFAVVRSEKIAGEDGLSCGNICENTVGPVEVRRRNKLQNKSLTQIKSIAVLDGHALELSVCNVCNIFYRRRRAYYSHIGICFNNLVNRAAVVRLCVVENNVIYLGQLAYFADIACHNAAETVVYSLH